MAASSSRIATASRARAPRTAVDDLAQYRAIERKPLSSNVVDGGLPAQRAVEPPRFLIGRDPVDPAGNVARIQIEDRIPRATLDDLMGRGHVFQKIGRKGEVRYGYASAVVIDVKAHVVEGGAEPRRSHAAVASK